MLICLISAGVFEQIFERVECDFLYQKHSVLWCLYVLVKMTNIYFPSRVLKFRSACVISQRGFAWIVPNYLEIFSHIEFFEIMFVCFCQVLYAKMIMVEFFSWIEWNGIELGIMKDFIVCYFTICFKHLFDLGSHEFCVCLFVLTIGTTRHFLYRTNQRGKSFISVQSWWQIFASFIVCSLGFTLKIF